MSIRQSLSLESTISADDPAWSKLEPSCNMQTGQLLSRESTIRADDPSWSKPSHISGHPVPIPPRNEPLIYIPKYNPHTALVNESSIDEREVGSHPVSGVLYASQEMT